MGYCVLVVEDTELLRRIYADRLAQDGYTVMHASDGLEALSVLRTNTPDLVLLDVIMPKMSGIEVLEVMKRDPRMTKIPVLVLSNLGQDSDVERCMQLGATDFLVKNEARPADVARKIRSVLTQTGPSAEETPAYRVLLRDREADAEGLVEHANLMRRFWCAVCEIELNLELLPKPGRHGWYDAHIVCPLCGREY